MSKKAVKESPNLSDLLGRVEDYKLQYYQRAADSLNELLHYPFKAQEKEGQNDFRYNNAERVNVVKDKVSRIVRCPIKFLDVVKYIQENRGRVPEIGVKYRNGSSYRYVHLLLSELDEGWVYVDNRRMLQVRDIHKFEKIRDYVGINKIYIIANQIGLPARHELSRIVEERGKILTVHHYDTIHNSSLTDYF